MSGTATEVESVDWNYKENATKHHTEQYELWNEQHHNHYQSNVKTKKCPVFRRGQSFVITLRFKRKIDFQHEHCTLVFQHRYPGDPKNTMNSNFLRFKTLKVSSGTEFTLDETNWDVHISDNQGSSFNVHVQCPATAIIGVYQLKVQTQNGKKQKEYKHNECIYLIFNPWCKFDPVYMGDESLLDEYILNDMGKIFQTHGINNFIGRFWVYGQFQEVVLKSSMLMLGQSQTTNLLDFSDPIVVSRIIAKYVNYDTRDKRGILYGNWKSYQGGKDPSDWTGSTEIMDQYYQMKGRKSVKFAQCWVYAGVVTTVCRAIGIPCRALTCYGSAHDSNGNLIIEKYWGSLFPAETDEKIWNYHCWNEAWMTRPDLPDGYGGWQALDSTPQYQPNELLMIGPCSVEALRRGDIHYRHDTQSLFAAVNGEEIILQWNAWTNKYIKFPGTKKIGYLIVTKKPGLFEYDKNSLKDMEDITLKYKAVKGSADEKLMKSRAISKLSMAAQEYLRQINHIPNSQEQDVSFTLVEIKDVKAGNNFNVELQMTSKANEKRTVTSIFHVKSLNYNGSLAEHVYTESVLKVLGPQSNDKVTILVKSDASADKYSDRSIIQVLVTSTVEEGYQIWDGSITFSIDKPELTLLGPEEIEVNKEYDLAMSFENPLNLTLTCCSFSLEGPGLIAPFHQSFQNVRPNEAVKNKFRFVPFKIGSHNIVVVFNSTQLKDIIAMKKIIVR